MSGEKGVMLCERPGPSQMDTSPGLKPFLPSSLPAGMEPLGLVPTAKTYPPSLAPKPPNINDKTFAAVREMEQENRLAALREEERRMSEAAKAEHVTAFGSHLRAAILAGEDISFWRAAKRADAVQQSCKARSTAGQTSSGNGTSGVKAGDAADGASSKADMASFVDDLLKEATVVLESPAAASAVRADGTADASTSAAAAVGGTPRAGGSAGRKDGGKKGGKGGSNKPAWALTAEEVAKLEGAEEEELLKFADDLDFDSFMAALDDVELQETVKAASNGDGGEGEAGSGPAGAKEKTWRRDLVKVMNHAAMRRVAAARRAGVAGEDDDGLSVVAVSEGGASAASRATAASKLKSDAAAAKRTALAEGGKDGGGWDGSSRAADDVARMERAKAATQEAFDFLRENPEMRAVHSPASVRAMISKTDGAAS